jgi:hypothetical protein
MKTTKTLALAVGTIAIFGAGCASTPEQDAKQCAYYTAIYEAYLVARETGNPSEAEVTAARVAGIFLKLHCARVQMPSTPATRGGPTPADADENGVPILVLARE